MLYYISLACFFVVVSPKYVNPMVDIGLIEEVITITDDSPSNPVADSTEDPDTVIIIPIPVSVGGNEGVSISPFEEVITITDDGPSNSVNIVDDTRIPIRPVVDLIDASSNPVSVGVNDGVSISPFANATSVFCGSKADTFLAVIGARLRLHCGLAGSATTVDSPTCVRGVTEALHSCSGLSRLDMEQCLANAVVRLDGDACGLPTHTPYGPIRTTLCNTLFHIEDSMKSSVRTFCIDDHAAGTSREGRGGCGFWTWTGCAAAIASASIVCCAATACVAEAACMAGVLGAASGCLACI